MDVKELVDYKASFEGKMRDEINTRISNFAKDTGISIKDIHFKRFTIESFGESDTVHIIKIDCELNL